MNNIDDYINSLRDDLYDIFVRNRIPDKRIGAVKEQVVVKSPDVDVTSDKLIFDYDSDVPETDENLLVPWA